MTVLWVEKTWMDIRDELSGGAPVLIPVGCVEEHGPHLPTGTDLFQADHVCVETAKRVTGRAVFLPRRTRWLSIRFATTFY